MIFRLMVILYSWVWNVPTWNPQTPDEWCGVLFGILFLDFPAIFFIGLAIIHHFMKKRRK